MLTVCHQLHLHESLRIQASSNTIGMTVNSLSRKHAKQTQNPNTKVDTWPSLFYTEKYSVDLETKYFSFFSSKSILRSRLSQPSLQVLVQNALVLYSTKE